jgi:DeoR/GlpR family transcriptional regulator of sugar metabolism
MRVPFHIVEARRRELAELIRRDGFLPVLEICARLKISTATARRDLAAIEQAGMITRTYGGALADYNTSFASIGERARQASSGKAQIARTALRHLPKQGVLFIDAGTTALALARLIATSRKGLVYDIVTNSIATASLLGGIPGLTLHMLGGEFLHRQSVLFGPNAVKAAATWKFDAAFLGAEAMNNQGIWNSHPDVVELQRAVIAQSASSYFMLDSTKCGRTTPHLLMTWKEIDRLISNTPIRLLQQHSIPTEKVIFSS